MWKHRKITLPADYESFIHREIKGVSEQDTFRKFRRYLRLRDSIPSLIRERQRIVSGLFRVRLRLVPGARGLIRKLSSRFRLAVASSSPTWRVRRGLRSFRLLKSFSVVMCVDQFRGRGKPDPKIYRLTAQQLGVRPDRCVVIEDAPNGVLAAKRAGMVCIALKHANIPRRSLRRADHIVSSLNQITPKFIDRLLHRQESAVGS